jgi:immunoglobulin-binding protein 1
MESSDSSLKELFERTKSQQDELDLLEPQSVAFKTSLQSIIDSLERCRQLIQKVSIFSTNEEVEDISTNDLQYENHLTFARQAD